jgi:hypothetical protein
MNTRSQAACAWAGLIGVVLILISLVLAHFVPPPRADATAAEIAAFYSGHTFSIRLGLLIGMLGMTCWGTLMAVVSVQLDLRRPGSTMVALQKVAGTSTYLLLTLFVVFLAVAAFRPERAPESTQLLHDVGWFMAFLTGIPFALQALAAGCAILGDSGQNPMYPRWLGYAGLWAAVLLVPGDLLLFFHSGPFAYHGLIAYWIPLPVFGGWMAALAWGALRAARAGSAVPEALPV